MSSWYIQSGPEGDVVLSTRIRLARNISEFAFPIKMDINEKEKVNHIVKEVVLKNGTWDFNYIKMGDLSDFQAVSLAEKHLISPEFTDDRKSKALLMTQDESVSIMLCEEDHIRLQAMRPGLDLEGAYAIADSVDNLIGENVNYAFDDRLGYLTACPTNLGTAMRASVMLHLPALTQCGQIGRLAATVSKLGLVIRGSFGEGSDALGCIYQLSNQITLGILEKTAIENLKAITLQLVAQERAAAIELVKDVSQQDKIYRAMGTLKSARLLSGDEFMNLISLVRFGISTGLFDYELEKINKLSADLQPASLNVLQGKKLTPHQRDVLRADIVREAFK